MQTATVLKQDWIGHQDVIMTRPASMLYLIQFRHNTQHDFGPNVTSLFARKGKWEIHGSYEDEKSMVRAFNIICQKPNVLNGIYTFRMVYPDGRIVESKVTEYA